MFVIDVETTGLNPALHSPISIGIVDFINPGKESFYVAFRAWEGAELDPRSLELNGFTEEQIRRTNPYSLSEAVDMAQKYIDGCQVKIPTGINVARLDIPMMMEACRRADRAWYYEKASVDLHALVFADLIRRGIPLPLDRFGKSALGSTKIFRHVGLPPEPRPHHALTGAKMEAEALTRLLYGISLFSEYAAYSVPEELKRVS